MIVRLMSGLLSALLLISVSLTSGKALSGREALASASSGHHPVASQVSDNSPLVNVSNSSGREPQDAPTDCCHLTGSCSNLAMTGEFRQRVSVVAVAQRIAIEDAIEPATLTLSVATPPPKA